MYIASNGSREGYLYINLNLFREEESWDRLKTLTIMAEDKMKNLSNEVELMNALLGKVYAVLTTGGKEANQSEYNFFVWCTPGVVVKAEDFKFAEQGLTGVLKKPVSKTTITTKFPWVSSISIQKGETKEDSKLSEEEMDRLLAEDTHRMYAQAESFARLVDFIPDAAPGSGNGGFSGLTVLYKEGGLSSVYDYTLRMSQVMKTELPEDVKAKIKKFNALLTVEKKKKDLITDEETTVLEDGPMVVLYREKMRAYNAALKVLNSKRVAALTAKEPAAVHDWALNAEVYQNEVEAAEADWVSRGYKNEYEQIQAFIDQVSRRDMSLLKEQYRNALDRAKLVGLSSGSDFYYTTLTPASFASADGWTKFSFKKTDMNSDYSSLSKNHSMKAGGRVAYFPFFSGGGGYSESEHSYDMSNSLHASMAEIRFEICQVSIVRPWFKEAFLTSKYWRFDANNEVTKGEFLSDGGSPAKGKMPAYPTSIVFIRNLRIGFDSKDSLDAFKHEYESHDISAGGRIGIGPFSLGGGYSSHDDKTETSSQGKLQIEKNEIVLNGMQIIGYACHMLGKSPDPNPDIKEWI